MARAAVRLVFAAVLALLSTQAGVPSVRVVTALEMVWQCQTESQQSVKQFRREPASIESEARSVSASPLCISFVKPEPDLVLSFQLPPPASLFV